MNKQIDESELKTSIYENLSQVLLAMASPARLRIVQVLSQAPRSVEELSQSIEQSVANTSQHLQKMAQAGIVRCRKEGVTRIYSLTDQRTTEIWETLQLLSEDLNPEIASTASQIVPEDICSPWCEEEVWKRVRSGKAVLVDVRDQKEVDASGVQGALHIPSSEIMVRKKELPKSKTIFLFCRGRYCHLANAATRSLRKAGYEVYRLKSSAFQIQNMETEFPKKIRG